VDGGGRCAFRRTGRRRRRGNADGGAAGKPESIKEITEMIGRKSIVGLSLLSALLFCAFAAQSASAEAWPKATNLTAYTCVKGATEDFADAHCDTSQVGGEYGHQLITEKTEIETSNTKTKNATTEAVPAVLKATVLTNTVTITCKKVEPDANATSWIQNVEPAASQHQVEGTNAVEFSECTTTGNGKECKVNEPITLSTFFHGVEKEVEIEPGKKETKMALESTPDPAGGPYVILKFTGVNCIVKEAEVVGSARGTGSGTTGGGATLNYSGAAEDEELFLVTGATKVKATFEGTFTTKMAGENGNAITITTPTG
jgi:hypothetical protein